MANFGESLKRERELRDIPLRDIANATKINLRYLEALEANRFDRLPGGVFNKGFIRAYARFIGADGEALVQRYMEEMSEREAAVASAQPTPDRPGLIRPAQGPPPRRADPAGGAGAAPAEGSPSITFVEGRAGSAAVAAMAAARRSGRTAPTGSADSFNPSATGPQARLILAATTVVAAFAALAIVLYLVRSARHDPRVPATSHEGAPASAPEAGGAGDPTAVPPQDSEAQEDGAAPDAPAAPPAGTDSEPSPTAPPQRTLPEVPHDRDGKTSPVRVASPIPTPVPETAKPVPHAAAPPPPQPPTAGADNAPPSPAGPMTLVVQGVNPVRVQLGCDGVDRPVRMLVAGESVTLRCYSLVRISTEDAGAVRLTLDGAACPPLGAAGSRVEHYTIRAEDARAICPPGGSRGRR